VRARLQKFKEAAPAVHADQQVAMVRELTYHLKQREELAVLTRGALALSKEVSKEVSGEASK
jgi:23S rRNA maturation mini-RNase III